VDFIKLWVRAGLGLILVGPDEGSFFSHPSVFFRKTNIFFLDLGREKKTVRVNRTFPTEKLFLCRSHVYFRTNQEFLCCLDIYFPNHMWFLKNVGG